MPSYPALIWGGDDGISNANIPNYLDLGHLNIGEEENVDINNATIMITKSYIFVSHGTTGITNQVATIIGGDAGSIIVLRCSQASGSTTIKDGTGNLNMPGDFVMNAAADTLVLFRVSIAGNWVQLARANNS